jgi:hypothetical protein
VTTRFAIMLVATACAAQDFTQRGFIETTGIFYPQTAFNDSGHAVDETLVRYEAFYKLNAHWRFAGGVDARTDTHNQVERDLYVSWFDRGRLRPALDIRRLSATYTRGKLTFEAGKQFIRWGKADILNPTDRFAPRDYLNVVQNDFLGITAARLTYGGQSDTIDLVVSPHLTPSRVPLLDQRWVVLPAGVPVQDGGVIYPGGAQEGARWNHIGRFAEYSLSFYNGYNHLPLFNTIVQQEPLEVRLQRYYPQMRMYGGDAAIPLHLVTIKGEAAYFTSSTKTADEYLLYVIQVERQAGEWFFVGGYAGEALTTRRSPLDFAPDRGLTRAFLARAGYTINTNRSIAFETAARQNGKGVWAKIEYSQAFGQHWRATAGFALIRGSDSDFLGQYHRNSHALLALRYSF